MAGGEENQEKVRFSVVDTSEEEDEPPDEPSDVDDEAQDPGEGPEAEPASAPAGDPDDPEEPPAGPPPAGDPPPDYYYEEVTLADLVVTLWDHRWPALAVLLVVVLGTAAFTAAQEPVYEATASLVPTHEQDVILAVLESDAYAAHVAQEVGLVDELGGGNPQEAGRTLRSQVSIATGSHRVQGEERQLIRVTASASDPSQATAVANAYVSKADWARSLLENATYDRNWKQYYEEAGKDPAEARRNLTGLVQGYTYYQPLDTASTPESPASPQWRLNLALGGTLGLMLGFMTPFVLEAASNVRAELQERRTRGD